MNLSKLKEELKTIRGSVETTQEMADMCGIALEKIMTAEMWASKVFAEHKKQLEQR